jgi:hypothetical protein
MSAVLPFFVITNNTAGIVGPALPGVATNPFYLNAPLVTWLVVGLLWVGTVYFLIRMRDATLERHPQHEPASSGVAILPNKLELCITDSL